MFKVDDYSLFATPDKGLIFAQACSRLTIATLALVVAPKTARKKKKKNAYVARVVPSIRDHSMDGDFPKIQSTPNKGEI